MSTSDDPGFPDRYNAVLNLLNEQAVATGLPVGHIATSAAFAVARFSVWSMTGGAKTAEDLEKHRQTIVEAFMKTYREMIDEHYDDFVRNFDTYARPQAVEVKS